jgi:hypothetical protein
VLLSIIFIDVAQASNRGLTLRSNPYATPHNRVGNAFFSKRNIPN